MPDAAPHSGTISDLEKNRALLEWLRWQPPAGWRSSPSSTVLQTLEVVSSA